MKSIPLMLVGLVAAAALCAAEKNPLAEAKMAVPDRNLLLPLTAKAVSSHQAYDTDKNDCSSCHKNKDPKNPGPLANTNISASCIECHDDFKKLVTLKYKHKPMEVDCTLCHNAHDSMKVKLLVNEPDALCMTCHDPIKNVVSSCKVQHDPVLSQKKCLNCHNPHASDNEHLLAKPAFDLCMDCHGKDGLTNHVGKLLPNMKTLLAKNPEQHGPVATKECTACHLPHGSDNYCVLNDKYPTGFYSNYDPKLYGLCFQCHEESAFATATTTTATQFRNGDKNLHYVHVNKVERGRSCRACHEIHASTHKHQIRDAVPYGKSGWMLKLNFTQSQTGGSCTGTCHSTRSYTNVVMKVAAVAPVSTNAPASK
jgi:predicted CXXCH cytochrome family protein